MSRLLDLPPLPGTPHIENGGTLAVDFADGRRGRHNIDVRPDAPPQRTQTARNAKLPSSRMIPAEHALRASLALKLWSIERKSHVMALVADQGLALFCGLNAMPKKSFLAEYSSRITPQKVSHLLTAWHAQLTGETILSGESFNLDFHSVPYFGDHPLVESH